MKNIINGLLANIHVFILLYGLYGVWVIYDEHSVQIEDVKSRSTSMDQEIINAQKKVKEIQEFVKKTDEFKTRVEEVARNIETVQKQLPAETNDNQILTFFNEEMQLLNIRDASLVPGKEDATTYFISKDYSLKAKGTFLQFMIFFERIGTAQRIYNIKELVLKNTEKNQKGRFQMITGEGIIQAFRFNPDFKVDRGFDKITAPVAP